MAVGAIVLAAGSSLRMGRAKALLEFEGRSFLSGIVARLRLAGIAPVVVVVARGDADVAAEAARAGARVAFDPDPERGLLSSLLAGLDLLETLGSDAFLLWPVDHPAVADATVMALRLGWERTRAQVVLPEHNGKRGQPVLFARSTFAELRRAPASEGARAVVEAHAQDRVRIGVNDPGILLAIDTPEEHDRLRRRTPGTAATPPGGEQG